MSSDTRLIERWLPIAALGEESVRERRSMTALPPTYYLHVWWARRPLVASRAAVLASVLPADADRDKFLHALGIHGDPVAARRRIDLADRRGERLGAAAYGYKRAFTYQPNISDSTWVTSSAIPGSETTVLDPTSGGGSIPFETTRLGISSVANELNPVATLVCRATVDWPRSLGLDLLREFMRIGKPYVKEVQDRIAALFPPEPEEGCLPDAYLWARTVVCPHCDGLIPLSPNWRLDTGKGLGVRLIAHKEKGVHSSGRRCTFVMVDTTAAQSKGTVSGGDAVCPYDDCGRVVDGSEIKHQAQSGLMGEQLYAIAYMRPIETKRKNGKVKRTYVRAFRAPTEQDVRDVDIVQKLNEKLLEWDALNFLPTEAIPEGLKTSEPIRYGMNTWRQLFSPRQLFVHGTSVEVYRQLLESEQAKGELKASTKAAFVYLAFAIDKLVDYNSRLTRWHAGRQVIADTLDGHKISFKWSYAEMAPTVTGNGPDWVYNQISKCIRELIELCTGEKVDLDSSKSPLTFEGPSNPIKFALSSKPADSLDHLGPSTIDVIVMDPPYYDNVMYAELADFFYVWLKRTAGQVIPDLFRTNLTDRDHDAVANPFRFKGKKGADTLAKRDYQQRMAAIFAECRRVLKADGIMTLMFTHKATDAWDALTKGLMEAAFTITASWPVNTESEGSLHIKDKAAANSTIFLVCRPREEQMADSAESYWEDVEPQVAVAVRERIKEFQDAGIAGVDLYLACFGPALQKFSEHWPLRRGTPRAQPEVRKRRKQAEMFEEPWDPYEVTPEDALDAARREVKRWRLQQLTHMKARADLDALTSFYVLAWDAFKAPKFDYDEALRLAHAIGVDLERDIIGHVAEKKSSEIVLWDSAKRAAKGAIGPADGSRSWLDAVHHAAYAARTRNLQHAQEMLNKAQVDGDPAFFAALEAVLEVLPVSKAFSGIDLEGDVAEFGSDFEALENLRKLAFAADVDEPQQLQLWKEDVEATSV